MKPRSPLCAVSISCSSMGKPSSKSHGSSKLKDTSPNEAKADGHQVPSEVSEKYWGDVLLQKTYVADSLTKTAKRNEGEVPQYYVEGHHEPIIEPRIWNQVQVELETRHTLKDHKAGTPKSYLFSSRLVCADCGGWYGRKVWTSNTKYRHTVW